MGVPVRPHGGKPRHQVRAGALTQQSEPDTSEGLSPGTRLATTWPRDCPSLRLVLLIERPDGVDRDPDPEAGLRLHQSTVLRVLALDDLCQFADRDHRRADGAWPAGHDGDVRGSRDQIRQETTTLVDDVVVVRHRLTRLDRLVFDRRAGRGNSLEPLRRIEAQLEAAAFLRERLDVAVLHDLARRDGAACLLRCRRGWSGRSKCRPRRGYEDEAKDEMKSAGVHDVPPSWCDEDERRGLSLGKPAAKPA